MADTRDVKSLPRQPRLEKHNPDNIKNSMLDSFDTEDIDFNIDVFEGKRLLYSYKDSQDDELGKVYTYGQQGIEAYYNKDKVCVKVLYDNLFVGGLYPNIRIDTKNESKWSIRSHINHEDYDDPIKSISLNFTEEYNKNILSTGIPSYPDSQSIDGGPVDVILPALPESVNVTAVPDLKEYKATSDKRLVLFMGTDIPELSCFVGYITESSKYIAPNMYDTTLGYWINIGPIYGQVDINTINNRFYLSYERDYQSGKLVNEFIRTSFMPLREGLGLSEYVALIDELWYVKYYDPYGSGKIITREDFVEHNTIKAAALEQYLPKVLTGLLNYK